MKFMIKGRNQGEVIMANASSSWDEKAFEKRRVVSAQLLTNKINTLSCMHTCMWLEVRVDR